jgi:3-hydroxyisobutyrate dehydrogenase-like beta-hydroxyacid dehydrogenase
MPDSKKATFIGLGSMGAPIARRLAPNGYSVAARLV